MEITMTTEEKAKRYDEAIKVAKNNYETIVKMDNDCTFAKEGIINTFHHMFPELKESEDEKIRRFLLKCVEQPMGTDFLGDIKKIDVIAWLKKQGEPIDKEKILIGARKHVALSIMNFLDRCTLGMCLSNMECKDLEDAIVDSDWSKVYDYMKKKLEKQGEQKSVITEDKDVEKAAEEYRNFRMSCGIKDPVTLNEIEEAYYEGAIKRQKPVDKVEPKFKVGDWCIDNIDGTIFQIVKVLSNTYTYKTNDDKEYSCTHYSLENDVRLWTIQDAKDGDVLVTKNKNIFIFKSIRNCTVYDYCGLYFEKFEDSSATVNGTIAEQLPIGYVPATKEQRNLLFQKMKEAGFEWDAEKKELKKIEQKPTEDVNLPEFENYLYLMLQKFRTKGMCTNGEIIDYVKNHSQKLRDILVSLLGVKRTKRKEKE